MDDRISRKFTISTKLILYVKVFSYTALFSQFSSKKFFFGAKFVKISVVNLIAAYIISRKLNNGILKLMTYSKSMTFL